MNTRRMSLIWVVCGCLAAYGAGLRAAEVSIAELIGGLKSGDEPARLKAIDELGARGPQAAAAVAPLSELLKDRSANVRAHAAWCLGAIGDAAKPEVPALVEMLKDPDAAVRRQAVQAVQAIHPGPKVVVPLGVKLLEDADPAIRVRVLSAMADAGVKAVPGLIEALNHEKAAYWACLVLREIGPAAKDAVPALAEKLKDPRPEIRREAALTLGAMGDAATAVIPQIVALLSDNNARTAATFVLGELGQIPADAEATLRANVKSEDKLLSTTSLWALARVHPEDKDLRRQATEELDCAAEGSEPVRAYCGGAGPGRIAARPGDHRPAVGEGLAGGGLCHAAPGPGCPGGAGGPRRAAPRRGPEVREAAGRGGVYPGADRAGRRARHRRPGQAHRRQE